MSIIFENVIVINTENVMGIEVNTYQSYDIVRYCDKGKIFQFTINEFNVLITKGINFLTQTALPPTVIDKMKRKLIYHPCAEQSAPVEDLLLKLVKDYSTLERRRVLNINQHENIMKWIKLSDDDYCDFLVEDLKPWINTGINVSYVPFLGTHIFTLVDVKHIHENIIAVNISNSGTLSIKITDSNIPTNFELTKHTPVELTQNDYAPKSIILFVSILRSVIVGTIRADNNVAHCVDF